MCIAKFFDEIISECTNSDHAGCLVSNLLLEKGGCDPDIRDEATGFWRATQQALYAQCARGLDDGSIRSKSSAATLASSLMTWMSGLRVAARANSSAQLKKANAAMLEALLG
jgi:hypothetical protein